MGEDQDPECGPWWCMSSSFCRSQRSRLGELVHLSWQQGHHRWTRAPEVMRRIARAASAMNQLGRVWRQRNLSLVTKLRVYESCVLSVLLYCAETWTLLKTDVNRLQAFHMGSLRRILDIRWLIT